MATLSPKDPKYPLVRSLRVNQSALADVRRAMITAMKSITVQLAALPDGTNPLTVAQLKAQRGALKATLGTAFKTVGEITDAGQRAAISAAYDTIYQYERPLLTALTDSKAGVQSLDVFAKSQAQTAANGTRTLMDRLGGSKQPLAKSVYNATAFSNNLLDNRINTAIVRGSSAKDFAASVIDLVNPNTPGGANYAANRLARTELNNAFHAGSIQRSQASGIVDSMDWKLSSSHPKADECNSLQIDSPYGVKSVPMKPHPHCFCFIVPRLPTEAEFMNNLLNGGYGDSPLVGIAQG